MHVAGCIATYVYVHSQLFVRYTSISVYTLGEWREWPDRWRLGGCLHDQQLLLDDVRMLDYIQPTTAFRLTMKTASSCSYITTYKLVKLVNMMKSFRWIFLILFCCKDLNIICMTETKALELATQSELVSYIVSRLVWLLKSGTSASPTPLHSTVTTIV